MYKARGDFKTVLYLRSEEEVLYMVSLGLVHVCPVKVLCISTRHLSVTDNSKEHVYIQRKKLTKSNVYNSIYFSSDCRRQLKLRGKK